MAATVKELEKRVAALEQEVASLRQRLGPASAEETLAEQGARLLREAKASQPTVSAAVARAFAEMGIVGEPVSAEELQAMMLACGVKPEDNAFSREIIAMRDE